jgi:hypothetical protein
MRVPYFRTGKNNRERKRVRCSHVVLHRIRDGLDCSRTSTGTDVRTFGESVYPQQLRKLYEPIDQTEIRAHLSDQNHALWLRGPNSTRDAELTHPQVFTGFVAGLGTTFAAPVAGHASSSLSRGNKPDDGKDHGRLPDIVGLLRTFDFVARLESESIR